MSVAEGLRDASSGSSRRVCAWCRGDIPAAARRDALTCSKSCRQARHRFTRGVGVAPTSAATGPLRIAYADPPYPGRSRRYYGAHQDYAGEVDHAALIAQLAEFDGWALSTAADSLPAVLALCPPGVRVAAWLRGSRHAARSSRAQSAWEPVIYVPARPVADPATTDALAYVARPRLTDPGRVVGAKPAAFCRWVFDILGALPGDELVDVFPGSGGVARAWEVYASPVAAGDASRLTAV